MSAQMKSALQVPQKSSLEVATRSNVLQRAAISPTVMPIHSGVLQRCSNGVECADCREKRLQRAAVDTSTVNSVPPIVHDVLNSSGQPLDADTRAFMEPRFGHDFSGVRVHTDARAAESARSVNALAYTVGRNVVFGTGQYAPGTGEGRRLLAHELTHVVQQKRQSETLNPKLVIDSVDSPFEQEANFVADTLGRTGLKPGLGSYSIQRQVLPARTSWNDLPMRAQLTINKDYFNTLDVETQKAFHAVYTALETEGLWDEVVNVIKVFPLNVRGIKAVVKDSLTSRIFSHPHFCSDTRLGGSQHAGAAMWRQVVQAGTEGLHVGVAGPKLMEAHLDTIAPVAGREANGECRYSMPYVLPHISRDLKGWRNLELFPPPTGEPKPGDIQPWIKITIPGT